MGLLDFLFAGIVLNSVKKVRHNSSQHTQGHTSDYNHWYEEGYDDSCLPASLFLLKSTILITFL